MDALTTLILAIPGTAIGIAYIRAFHYPLPVIDVALTSMWFVLPLVLAVRRLPYTVRGSYSSLLLVHKSMEEAAENVGATKLRTFRDITVPLVWKGILVGGLFSFIMSIQEASATLLPRAPPNRYTDPSSAATQAEARSVPAGKGARSIQVSPAASYSKTLPLASVNELPT